MKLFSFVPKLLINQRKYTTRMGLPLDTIVEKLQGFAPLLLAEKWDNVGLLVNPMSDKNVDKILLTNDLTEDVVDEAIQYKAGLIVSYHPNIFQGLKSVTERTWKERVVIQCILNNIAVFSPHTTWDCVQGGVNDWLSSAFAYEISKPIQEHPEDPLQGAGRMLKLRNEITIKKAIDSVKNLIEIEHLRLALGKGKNFDSSISVVALCAGSGHSVLSGTQADLYLTGEMLHHDVLDATQKGISVILCNHSDSERGFLRVFQHKLRNDILEHNVDVMVSKADHDPLCTV